VPHSSTASSSLSEKVELVLTPAQEQLDQTLRAWRTAEAAKTGKPAFLILSDATLRAVAQSTPKNLTQLQQVPGIGPDKAERFGPTIIALCSGAEVPGDFGAPTPKPRTQRPSAPTQNSRVPHSSAASSRMSGSSTLPKPTPTSPLFAAAPIPIVRPAHTPEPTGETFTPDQQALEQRLRDWRKSESERMGLPQFFVLGTTALRSIVLTRPRTLAQLQSIHGIGPDKIDRFGPSILAVCNT
jgi:ATP-dependent DNA helicase RecQ